MTQTDAEMAAKLQRGVSMQVWCSKAAALLLVTSWVCLVLARLAKRNDDQSSDDTNDCGHSYRGLSTEEIEAFKMEC